MSKICVNCGATLDDAASFCANCGSTQPNSVPQQPMYQQPTYQQPMYQQPGFPQPMMKIPSAPGKGLGIASMVIGIVSLVLFCTGWIAIICAIVGIALGAASMYKAKQAGMKSGMTIAGLTCSIVALGILLILVLGASAIGCALEDALEDLM